MQKTVILADDSITIQKAVAICLAGERINIVNSDNGEDALSKIRALKPDLVFADASMPRKNGYELCQAIRRNVETGGIPFILLTGTSETPNENMLRESGIDGILAKPFDSRSIISIVNKYISRDEDTSIDDEPVIEVTYAQMLPSISPSPMIEDVSLDGIEQTSGDIAINAVDNNILNEAVRKAVAEAVKKMAGEIIEKIAWEVVPDRAEAIIRDEIKRLLADDAINNNK